MSQDGDAEPVGGRRLRIAQVVPYVSRDGAFGGPVSVAVEQSRALAAAGHEVTLVAGWDGDAALAVPGVDVRLHRARPVVPVRHLSALFAPGVARAVRALADVDVLHLHLPRDLTTVAALRAVRRDGPRVVVQTHGMVPAARSPFVGLFDRLWMRPALRRAACQVVLTSQETTLAQAGLVGADLPVHEVPNGVTRGDLRAQWRPVPEVLFCSRLHPRKRPGVFVQAAEVLLRNGSPATFTLVGPDEGCLAEVEDLIARSGLQDHVRYAGALPHEEVLTRLAAAQCFVLPSVDEPFPMALLEALSVGLPSVVTDSTGISADLRDNGGALVTDGSVAEVAEAVARVVSADHPGWERLSAEAGTAAERYSSAAMGRRLMAVYALLAR